MRKLVQTFMNEPAVALGVLAAAIVAAFKLAGSGALTADDMLAILTPLGTGVGIRRFVCPCIPRPESDATPVARASQV